MPCGGEAARRVFPSTRGSRLASQRELARDGDPIGRFFSVEKSKQFRSCSDRLFAGGCICLQPPHVEFGPCEGFRTRGEGKRSFENLVKFLERLSRLFFLRGIDGPAVDPDCLREMPRGGHSVQGRDVELSRKQLVGWENAPVEPLRLSKDSHLAAGAAGGVERREGRRARPEDVGAKACGNGNNHEESGPHGRTSSAFGGLSEGFFLASRSSAMAYWRHMQTKRVAVIGAGMAGIAAARTLEQAGIASVIFEKARGWGGRCATKRWEGHVIDHGSQYFSIRHPVFRAEVEARCQGKMGVITAPIVTERGDALPEDERFYHLEGNNRLTRDLGAGLEVITDRRIESIDGCRLNGEDFDAVVCTAPMPQTLDLVGLDGPDVYYAPCLVGAYAYKVPFAGKAAAQYAFSDRSGDPLAWSACENHKQGRVADGFVVVVALASEEFSTLFLDEEHDAWETTVREMVEARWELPADAFHGSFTHRWRFARVEPIEVEPELPAGWFFAGDALTGPRVESAWMAGRMVGDRVIAQLS